MKTRRPQVASALATVRIETLRAGLLPSLAALLAATVAARAQFSYTTTNGAITVTGYTGSNDNIVIPSTIDGLPVTDIGSNAFGGSSITSAIIPDSVTNIGNYAFYDCFQLTNLSMGDSVVNIGAFAFSGYDTPVLDWPRGSRPCPLTSVTIPDGVTTIGDYAFYGCDFLTNVSIGDHVKTIGAYAFSGLPGPYPGGDGFGPCPLTSVTIPNSVTSIGTGAFCYCPLLTNITLSLGLTDIESNAFAGCFNLTTLAIPNSVINIGDYAFQQCSGLTTVTIGSGVTNIGDSAFEGCYNLTGVYFQGNAPSADSTVFWEFSHQPLQPILVAFYLPGTTGWNAFATNTGIPTAFWILPNPLVLNGSSGVQSNQFGFVISWATNAPVIVEASSDLANSVWTPVATNTLNNGTSAFSDPRWINYPSRFYRVRSQ